MIWAHGDVIVNGRFMPKHVMDNELVENPWAN